MDEKTSSAPMQEDPQKGEELSFTITGEDAEAQDALNAKKPEPQQKKKSPLPWILGAAAVIIAAALVLILTIKPSQTTPDADQPGDATVREARARLDALNLVGTPFSERYPAAQLHWLLADKDEAVVIESMADGLHVYDDPAGVLTNNPPFPQQLFNLNNYMALSPRQPENRFSGALGLHCYSRGMGALGLPGDLSSMSRFVRVAYTKLNAVCRDTEAENVSQFFHILGAVEQQRGCCEVADGQYERTIYTSCCNATRGIYYYTTYDNHQITAVDLHRAELDGETLSTWPLVTGEQIFRQN